MQSAPNDKLSGACVILRSHKGGEKGILMYPGDRGQFKTDEARKAYQDLFVDEAPFLPYAEVGSFFAKTKCSVEQRREACLEHMRSKGWEPKEVNAAFWEADKKAQENLVFPIAIVREKAEVGETPVRVAARGVWEETGIRADPGELKLLGYIRNSAIFEMHTSMQRAFDSWAVHQAERLSLTDWGRCPHSGVLDFLGVPRAVKSAYCETHGGPVLVKDINDHLVEKVTQSILKTV
ncbi:MAG: hypothetical protein CME58_12740 [Halieaceae bacterium]|nr:hypothetical protein [Halieaceae bacterium]|tara:strand:+ start:2416 stop:3123 length:708 start_codon:yes stop_codon:yes gene_type:complete